MYRCICTRIISALHPRDFLQLKDEDTHSCVSVCVRVFVWGGFAVRCACAAGQGRMRFFCLPGTFTCARRAHWPNVNTSTVDYVVHADATTATQRRANDKYFYKRVWVCCWLCYACIVCVRISLKRCIKVHCQPCARAKLGHNDFGVDCHRAQGLEPPHIYLFPLVALCLVNMRAEHDHLCGGTLSTQRGWEWLWWWWRWRWWRRWSHPDNVVITTQM